MRHDGNMATIGIKTGYSEAELADSHRQYKWEKGQIDYLGKRFKLLHPIIFQH